MIEFKSPSPRILDLFVQGLRGVVVMIVVEVVGSCED